MALDPGIPLSVQSPQFRATDLFRAIDFADRRKQRGKENRLLDLQIEQTETQVQEFKDNAETRKFKSLNEREQSRIRSLALGAVEILPDIDSGDVQGAISKLEERKAALVKVGLPTNDTDEMIQLLQTNPQQAFAEIRTAVQVGERAGILRSLKTGLLSKEEEEQKIRIAQASRTSRGEFFVPLRTQDGSIVGFDSRRNTITRPGTDGSFTGPVIDARFAPDLQGRVEGAKAQSKSAAKLRDNLVTKSNAIDEQLTLTNEALQQFMEFTQNKKLGTGPIATLGGATTLLSADTQALNSKFKTIALKSLVAQFAGFSRSIDTGPERRAFESTQPSITLDDPVNFQILVGGLSLGTKAQAEARARKVFIATSKNKSLEGYESPIFGKTKVLFSPEGKPEIILNEHIQQAKSQGFLDAREFSQLLSSRRPIENTRSQNPAESLSDDELRQGLGL